MLARRARRAREITSLLARGARSDVFLANDASREASTSSRRSKPSNETKPSEAKRTLLQMENASLRQANAAIREALPARCAVAADVLR